MNTPYPRMTDVDWAAMGPATGGFVLTCGYRFWSRCSFPADLDSFKRTADRVRGAKVWQEHERGAVRIY